MSKIEKTIARQKAKIQEGDYYEAHQTTLTISRRHLKALHKDITAALSILHSGALLLFKAGQGGSGADCAKRMLDVYNHEEISVDAEARGRCVGLLRAWPRSEEDRGTRKRFVGEVISWSSKFGEFPAGDPELHHVIGQIFAQDGEVYDAERHLTLGTKDSAQVLARLEYDWYTQDESHTAAMYAARAVLPLLLVGNLRAANEALVVFTSQLMSSHQSLANQVINSASSEVRIFPSLPLLNFLSLLLLTVQRTNAELYRRLTSHYAAYIRDVSVWDEALDHIADMYFGIRKPKQSNPLMDIMGSMFGGGAGAGGGGGGGGSLSKAKSPKPMSPAPAPAVD